MNDNIFKYLRGKEIKAILFDMDGTLFDSEIGTIQMMKEVALAFRDIKSTVPFEDLVGLSYPDKLEKIIGGQDKDLLDIVTQKGSEIYSQIATPIYGVENALKQMKANNLKLAVCTNGDINFSKPVFEKIDVKMDLFQGTKGMQKKPAPDVFAAAIKFFEITPEEALVIEDSKTGINAAIAAGIPEKNIIIFDTRNAFPKAEQKFKCWVEFSKDERKTIRR